MGENNEGEEEPATDESDSDMLAESKSGYCYNLEIYAGQRAEDDVDREVGGATYATVMRLARPCFGRRHHL